jgi:hypothetical protein
MATVLVSVFTNSCKKEEAPSEIKAGVEYGFKAVPGGDRDPGSGFWSFGTSGMWWSTTEYNASTVHCRALNYNSGSVEN